MRKEVLLYFHKLFTVIKDNANGGIIIIERCLEKGPDEMTVMDYYDIKKTLTGLLKDITEGCAYSIEKIFKN